jgi:hypothetical protein
MARPLACHPLVGLTESRPQTPGVSRPGRSNAVLLASMLTHGLEYETISGNRRKKHVDAPAVLFVHGMN